VQSSWAAFSAIFAGLFASSRGPYVVNYVRHEKTEDEAFLKEAVAVADHKVGLLLKWLTITLFVQTKWSASLTN